MRLSNPITPSGRKKCRGCHRYKPIDRFYGGKRDGLRPRCKTCTTRENLAWRKANPEKHRLTFRRVNHRSNLRLRFGITIEQFDAIYAACDGKCAICRKPETRGRRLSLDHDHETGELRGFLCSRCNLLIGNAKDDPVVLERAAVYVRTARIVVPTIGVKFLPGFKDEVAP